MTKAVVYNSQPFEHLPKEMQLKNEQNQKFDSLKRTALVAGGIVLILFGPIVPICGIVLGSLKVMPLVAGLVGLGYGGFMIMLVPSWGFGIIFICMGFTDAHFSDDDKTYLPLGIGSQASKLHKNL